MSIACGRRFVVSGRAESCAFLINSHAPISTTQFARAWVGVLSFCFFFQAEDGIRDLTVTGVQTCALPIFLRDGRRGGRGGRRARDHACDLPPPADGQSAEHQPAQGLMPAPPLSLLWVVPALPLAGFVVNGALALTRPTAKRAVSIVGVGTLVLAFAAAALAVAELARQHATAPLVFRYWEWLPVGDLQVAFALQLDQLAAVMILVVTGVGALIHVFSVGYMYDDPGYARYFAYLNLFVFFMLILVLGASFPVMFVGWEGVGLCSYLLIGFWFTEKVNADAGKKAFIVNRIGDFGFLVAMLLIFQHTGSLEFGGGVAKAPAAFAAGGTRRPADTAVLFP